MIKQTVIEITQGEIMKELLKAEEKFPWWPEDIIHAAAILQEECGELIRASLQYYYQGGSIEKVKKEMLQTGAMVFRFAIGLEQGYINEDMKEGYLKKEK